MDSPKETARMAIVANCMICEISALLIRLLLFYSSSMGMGWDNSGLV